MAAKLAYADWGPPVSNVFSRNGFHYPVLFQGGGRVARTIILYLVPGTYIWDTVLGTYDTSVHHTFGVELTSMKYLMYVVCEHRSPFYVRPYTRTGRRDKRKQYLLRNSIIPGKH